MLQWAVELEAWYSYACMLFRESDVSMNTENFLPNLQSRQAKYSLELVPRLNTKFSLERATEAPKKVLSRVSNLFLL